MDRRRRSTRRCVALSDEDSSRLLMQAHFADRIISSVAAQDDAGTGKDSTTTTSVATPKMKGQRKPATVFRCPVCKRAECVECRVDREARAAEASCCACGASYRGSANALTDPIDVYSAWTDERHRAKELGGVRLDCDGDVVMGDGDAVMCDA